MYQSLMCLIYFLGESNHISKLFLAICKAKDYSDNYISPSKMFYNIEQRTKIIIVINLPSLSV